MAIRIKSRHGESVNQMLRRFKKLCEKEGLTKDVKRKQYFEKPSLVAFAAVTMLLHVASTSDVSNK